MVHSNALEKKINKACARISACSTPVEKRAAFQLMGDLIARRSPEKIEAMERSKGLR